MLTVKEWRKAKGLSIVKVAEMLEVSPVTWSSWEEEPYKIPIGKTHRFCEIVGAEPEEVIFCPETTRNV